MKIKRFAIGIPDPDREVRTAVECVVTNPTTEEVRLIAHTFIVTDRDGFAVGSRVNDRRDCSMEPGGETTITPWLTLEHVISQSEDRGLSLTMSATLYARDFHPLGEVEVPAKDLSCVRLERTIVSKTIDAVLKVNVIRLQPDEEGHIDVKPMVLLRNKTDHYLPRVEMKSELLDSDDGVIEEATDQVTIDARSATCLEGTFGWLKRGQLRKARLRLGLYVFRPVHWEECSMASSPADESDALD